MFPKLGVQVAATVLADGLVLIPLKHTHNDRAILKGLFLFTEKGWIRRLAIPLTTENGSMALEIQPLEAV